MIVKELITQLLDCDMDKEIYLSDNVEYDNEHGHIKGAIYQIERINERGVVYLDFENRNHYLVKGGKE